MGIYRDVEICLEICLMDVGGEMLLLDIRCGISGKEKESAKYEILVSSYTRSLVLILK